ncbi:hypothetical protein ACIBIZ_33430 [Nonomuraea spiralis]|uniref:hypothetical protein n=1 Tax=Nonomuraea TaxID=83681 RepID=UPI000F7A950E|nr:hypothetical protein [Nonomuraea sp. WAC 01424]
MLNVAAGVTKDQAPAHGAYGHWGVFRYYWTAVKLVLLVAVACVGRWRCWGADRHADLRDGVVGVQAAHKTPLIPE